MSGTSRGRWGPERLWPLAVVAVLGLTVGASGMLLWATRDPGAAAVEPDYYGRSLRWDSTMAEQRRSAALGWRLDAELGSRSSAGTPLVVRLADRDGAPLDSAAVEVEGIHNLDPLRPVRARLAFAGAGAYVAVLPLSHAGLWELRLVARRGAARFTTVRMCDAPSAAAAPAGPAGRAAGDDRSAP